MEYICIAKIAFLALYQNHYNHSEKEIVYERAFVLI